MIFPQINYKEWLKRYKDLEVESDKCSECNKLLITHKPFITKDWIGLTSEICTCGGDELTTVIPRTINSGELLRSIYVK